MLIILSAWIVLPALAATAVVAVSFRSRHSSKRSPTLIAFLMGATVPFFMLVYGLCLGSGPIDVSVTI